MWKLSRMLLLLSLLLVFSVACETDPGSSFGDRYWGRYDTEEMDALRWKKEAKRHGDIIERNSDTFEALLAKGYEGSCVVALLSGDPRRISGWCGEKDNTGLTVLMRASKLGDLDIVKVFLAAGAQLEMQNPPHNYGWMRRALDVRDNNGKTALIHAIKHVSPYDFDMPNRFEQMRDALRRQVDIVKMLLAAGAQPNVEDDKGRPPLWFALQAPYDRFVGDLQSDIVEMLVAAGARLDMPEPARRLAVASAKLKGLDIVKMLRDAEAQRAAKRRAATKMVDDGI